MLAGDLLVFVLVIGLTALATTMLQFVVAYRNGTSGSMFAYCLMYGLAIFCFGLSLILGGKQDLLVPVVTALTVATILLEILLVGLSGWK